MSEDLFAQNDQCSDNTPSQAARMLSTAGHCDQSSAMFRLLFSALNIQDVLSRLSSLRSLHRRLTLRFGVAAVDGLSCRSNFQNLSGSEWLAFPDPGISGRRNAGGPDRYAVQSLWMRRSR